MGLDIDLTAFEEAASLGLVKSGKKLDLKKAVENPKSEAPQPSSSEPKAEPKKVITPPKEDPELEAFKKAQAEEQDYLPRDPPPTEAEMDAMFAEWQTSRKKYLKAKEAKRGK